MEIKLNFNTLCYIMLYLSDNTNRLNQKQLVSRYISCIDMNNSVFYANEKESLDKIIKNFKNNNATIDGTVISNIMSGKSLLRLKSDIDVYIDDIPKSSKIFNELLASCFPSKNKQLLILLILNLIVNDDYNCDDSRFYNIFKTSKEDFIAQKSFVLSDLMIRTLIYTIFKSYNDINHEEYSRIIQKNVSKKRKTNYILEKDDNFITNYINNPKSSISTKEYLWDDKTQTLTFINKTETKAEEQTLPVIRKSKLQANSDAAAPSKSTKTTSLIETSSTTEQPKTHNEDELNQLETSCSSSFTIEETHRMCQFCCSFKRDKHLPKEKGICTYEKEHKIVESNSICKVFRIKYSSVLLGK